MSTGWIKLHRKILDWEWYDDVNTTRVFLHLLLVANHKDNNWRGIEIKRGQRLTSISGLAAETHLSIKNIRTSIKRLKSTNEVASHSTAQHTVFTMINYDLYQDEASEVANKGQAKGKQGATNNNDKNEKNVKEVIDHLNLVTNAKYKNTTKSHVDNISARLNDGHSVDDLKIVIDSKSREWLTDKNMAQYLRPSTLFQASKFQGYLLSAKPITKTFAPKEFSQ